MAGIFSSKISRKDKKRYRLIFSVLLSILLFVIMYYVLPTRTGDVAGEKKILKTGFIAFVFGFLPFYILPWLKWIMGHDNDLEEDMDGKPKHLEG